MKTRTILIVASIALALCLHAPAWSADVSQGKCVSYDDANKTVIIEEYDVNISKENPHGKPTGKQVTFSLASALMGGAPKPGDMLRIAYEEKGGKKEAVRLMNITRTDIMKK